MAYPEYQDEEYIVMNLVENPIVASSHSPLSRSAHELGRGWRARIVGEKLDCRLKSTTHRRIELTELSSGDRRELNNIGHISPRSAFTSSHGIGATPT